MGTVLSFSPRERRPVYSTYHNHGTLSSSGSADYPLNNYSYEQLNNVKNRENSKSSLCQVPNNNSGNIMLSQTQNNHHHNHHHLHTHNGTLANTNNTGGTKNNNNNNNNLTSNLTNNNITNNNSINNNNNNNNNNSDRNDTARILSEKNALEKNLKKHSLFINALSWKRLAATHSKKKLDNNKNKAANLPTATFRPPLVEAVHPLVVDKNKNIQQQNHHQYFTPGANAKALLALDLVRANNTNNAQQHLEKLTNKLPLSIPLQTAFSHAQQQQQQQHQSMLPSAQQHSHVPRKTVIQVNWIEMIFSHSLPIFLILSLKSFCK